jgi:hypothetical protein
MVIFEATSETEDGTTADTQRRPRTSAFGRSLGFWLNEALEQEIVRGKAFVQIKTGPFDVDLIFAPDGIESYEEAKSRIDESSGFPVLNIRDIIASKRAACRARDLVELPLLEALRDVYEKRQK